MKSTEETTGRVSRTIAKRVAKRDRARLSILAAISEESTVCMIREL